MSYDYQTERVKLFTDQGQRMFLAIRGNVDRLLADAGAFQAQKAFVGISISGDTWIMLACLDRMVELCEITEVPQHSCAGQTRLFIRHD